MSSSQAQKQRILKLNTKDKKLTRLLSFSDLSDRDSLFLCNAYNEKQQLFFKYAVICSLLSAVAVKVVFFRLKRGFTVYGGMLGAAGMSHLYWSSVINKRFNKMVDPYFAKYRIK